MFEVTIFSSTNDNISNCGYHSKMCEVSSSIPARYKQPCSGYANLLKKRALPSLSSCGGRFKPRGLFVQCVGNHGYQKIKNNVRILKLVLLAFEKVTTCCKQAFYKTKLFIKHTHSICM